MTAKLTWVEAVDRKRRKALVGETHGDHTRTHDSYVDNQAGEDNGGSWVVKRRARAANRGSSAAERGLKMKSLRIVELLLQDPNITHDNVRHQPREPDSFDRQCSSETSSFQEVRTVPYSRLQLDTANYHTIIDKVSS
eukprot:scaffold2366_cov159-Amphora_coffeaeformis.AAC.18